MFDKTDQLAVTTIRTLSIDAIEKANSGHPGLPMGAAPMAYALWSKVMNHNPKNPQWFNRDRFVLSAGHGSMRIVSQEPRMFPFLSPRERAVGGRSGLSAQEHRET